MNQQYMNVFFFFFFFFFFFSAKQMQAALCVHIELNHQFYYVMAGTDFGTEYFVEHPKTAMIYDLICITLTGFHCETDTKLK